MTTVTEQIQNVDRTIFANIELLAGQRALLSQNLLSQLRNLVEGVAVRLHSKSHDAEYKYDAIAPAIDYVKSQAKYSFLGRFHKLIQKSASHYTMNEDASERLMLKYYEYLYRIRSLLQEECGIFALANLDDFPVDLDPSLREYHEKIAERIESLRSSGRAESSRSDRYYVHKTRPFFVGGRIYYEVTFYSAINKVSKFDRIIAFTHIDINDKYSAQLLLKDDSIEVLGRTMPLIIIREWAFSIRPCEFDNFARLLGISTKVQATSREYSSLMRRLTINSGSLLDLMDMSDEEFARTKSEDTSNIIKPQIYPLLEKARRIVRSRDPGSNVLRYLLLRMHNKLLKLPYHSECCHRLSGLNIKYGCIPFETMPYCTSLPNHNPRYWDLVESLDISGRKHELLARRVVNNVENHGTLYTPVADLAEFEDINGLIIAYNSKLYYRHQERQILLDRGHVFIRGYENDTVSIVRKLREYASSGISGYTAAVESWLNHAHRGIDDPVKKDALKQLFSQSCVALVYGAAGTGKSTMVDHIAQYFNDKEKLFLAHTYPAIDNLKRRVTAQRSEFRTIRSQIGRRASDKNYDLLVIDECSTVSNADLLGVLTNTSFKLLVLVGDAYQIESIQFGNWFGIIRSFIPGSSVFELTTPFRATNASLLGFWNKVRAIEDDIAEDIARNRYSSALDESLFKSQSQDEIILCLNYDGLYGINNINRFLQSSNPGAAVTWRVSTYKIGDPVLFNDTERFRPVIYNNLKGRIVGLDISRDWIQFDIKLERPLSAFDVVGTELEWIAESTVRFKVYDRNVSDDDDDSLSATVPFQVAYAVSIHKAQGLEYDSVKIVITDANEDDVTHSIFYTAITRARERLKIFWTPETQQRVLSSLRHSANRKDVSLLASRSNLVPNRR